MIVPLFLLSALEGRAMLQCKSVVNGGRIVVTENDMRRWAAKGCGQAAQRALLPLVSAQRPRRNRHSMFGSRLLDPSNAAR